MIPVDQRSQQIRRSPLRVAQSFGSGAQADNRMPAYVGTGKTPDAALWESASSSTEISDEVLFDIRSAVGLFGRRYRLLRRLATPLDEVNATYTPDEIPRLVEEIEDLQRAETRGLADSAPSFPVELSDFQKLLQKASESQLYVVAHLEHHVHPADLQAEKRKRGLSKADEG
jgi:hypothetical protein